jgi:hypothetical protein
VSEAVLKLTEDQLEELCLRQDLAFFARKMLNMEIVDHHRSWSEYTATEKRLCILCSRDHGKSFFFSFAYVIWRAYWNWIPPLPSEDFKSIPRQALGYIFSASQDKAIEFLELVKEEIETNANLIHLKPPSRSTWSKTEIKCSNGSVVRARGYGVAVRGGHPCYVICDDVLSDENIYSEVTREKAKDYFYSAITPMVIPGGQLVVIGTPMHQADLYGDLTENKEYKFSRFPAVRENGSALWPTRYTRDMLKKREMEIGTTRFAREYLCLPVSDESSLFPEKVIKENFDYQASLIKAMTPELHQEYDVFVGVDLAMSASVGADYTAIVAIGVDRFKNRRLLDLRRFKGRGMTDQLREIEDVYYSFKPQKVFIEDNQFQRVFKDEIVKHTDIPVEGFTTTARNKNSLENGVPSLQVLLENSKFQIPRKTERDRRITDVLVNELKCFTYVNGKLQGVGTHDDTVMALWIANECAASVQFTFSFG